MKAYTVVFFDAGKKVDGLSKFIEVVNEHIANGWTPTGGLVIHGSAIYQAMVGEDPKQKTLLG
jgi:hypothetical protein